MSTGMQDPTSTDGAIEGNSSNVLTGARGALSPTSEQSIPSNRRSPSKLPPGSQGEDQLVSSADRSFGNATGSPTVLTWEGWEKSPEQLLLSSSPRTAAVLPAASRPNSQIPLDMSNSSASVSNRRHGHHKSHHHHHGHGHHKHDASNSIQANSKGSLISLNNGTWHPPAGPAPGDPSVPGSMGRPRPQRSTQPVESSLQNIPGFNTTEEIPSGISHSKLSPIQQNVPAPEYQPFPSHMTEQSLNSAPKMQGRARSSTTPHFPFQPISTTLNNPPTPVERSSESVYGSASMTRRRAQSDPDQGRDNEKRLSSVKISGGPQPNSKTRSDRPQSIHDSTSANTQASINQQKLAVAGEDSNDIPRLYHEIDVHASAQQKITEQIDRSIPHGVEKVQKSSRLTATEAARMQEAVDGRIDDIMRENERRRAAADHRRVASARTSKEEAYSQARRSSAASSKRGKVIGMSVSAEDRERERLVAIRAMGLFEIGRDPRLDAVTSLTARLLNSEVCMITIVDHSTVYWWSVCDRGGYLSPEISRETRSESFCHYAIRDDKRGGFVILDASQEERFRSKPLASRGLSFYAGAPLIISGGIKVGALSIRGPPRASFSAEEADILRQMAEWAVGEIEILQLRREQEVNDAFQSAKWRLSELMKDTNWEEDNARKVLAQALDIIRNALKARNVMILKISSGADGTIRSTVHSLATECQLNLGEEKFTELALGCLNKAISTPLILDPQPVSIQLNVGRFVGQDVLRSASELIWSANRPVGVLVAFFAGKYRAVTQLEESFVSTAATVLSSIWTQTEQAHVLSSLLSPTHGAHLLKSHLTKLLSNSRAHHLLTFRPRAARKSLSTISTTSFSSIIAAAQQRSDGVEPTLFAHPAVVLVEPILPNADIPNDQRCATRKSMLNLATKTSPQILVSGGSPVKGMEQAHAVAVLRGGAATGRVVGGGMPVMTGIGQQKMKREKGDAAVTGLRPRGCVELLTDFSEMFDVLAKQRGIQTVWHNGNLFMAIVGLEEHGITKTCEDLISLVLDLSLTLAEYGEETGIHVRARVGIHGDAVSADLIDDTGALEAAWTSIVNTAYHLSQVSHSSSILVSDNIFDETCSTHRYLPRGTVFTLGHGATGAHVLVGPKLFNEDDDDSDSFRGGTGDGMLGVAARVRRARELQEAKRLQELEMEGEVEVKTAKRQSCEIM